MRSGSTIIALAPALLAGYVLAAVPNHAAPKRDAAKVIESEPAQVLAQAEQPGLEAQEQGLLNQIQADSAKLKADEAAEQAQQRHVNPQIRFIRASLLRLSEAAGQLEHTTMHYKGHRRQALKAMAEAHDQLMACYRIDSQ